MSHAHEGNTARNLDDEAYASRITVAGRALAANLSVFWKTARIYDARNVAYMQSLSNLVDSLAQLHSLGSDFVIQVVGDCLYVNDQRLKVDVVGYASHQFICDELARRHRGVLRIAAAFAALLLATAAISTWQAVRATRAEHQVHLTSRDRV